MPGSALRRASPADALTLSRADIAWLMELLAVPSVSPLEGGEPEQTALAQQIVRDGACRRGFTVRLLGSPRASEITGAVVPAAVRANLAEPGWLAHQPSLVLGFGEPQPERRRLVINFHVDTVGPHVPPRRDGWALRGRGTADDKGPGVAAAVGIAAAFAADPTLERDIEVLLVSVPGEEGGAMGTYGTRWLVEREWTGRLMIFAEPTGMRAFDASSATMTARFSVTGDDATDDHPGAGHNATVALALLTDQLAREVVPVAEQRGAKICLAGLHTGESHNRVFGRGQLLVNAAYFTPADGDELRERIERVLAASARVAGDRYGARATFGRLVRDWSAVVTLDWLKRGLPPLANRDPSMESVLAAAGLPRRNAVDDGVAFTCDAIWASGPGRYVAACGPGTLDGCGAHTADEHIDIAELDRYAHHVRDLVLGFGAWCRAPADPTHPESATDD
jgi:acetylornithine deacetylase/succinyl-diaminopimelate desuccinylase-like protein